MPRQTIVPVLALLLALAAPACGGSASAPTASTPATPTIASLSILGSPLAEAGASGYQFIAIAQYSNFTSGDVSTSATWTCSNAQIAAFVPFGGRLVLNTFRPGTVTITAAYGGKTASLTVTVI